MLDFLLVLFSLPGRMAAGTFLRLPSIRGGVSSGGAVPPELSVHLSAAAGPSGKRSHPTVSHSAAVLFGGPSTGGSDRLSAAAGLFDGQRPAIVSHSVGLSPGGYRFACPRQPVHRAVSLPAAPGLLVDCGLQWPCPKLRFPYPACFLSPCSPLAPPPGVSRLSAGLSPPSVTCRRFAKVMI